MNYSKCQCGKVESRSSQGHRPCEGCEDCGTTFAQNPNDHKKKEPHGWVTRTTLEDGVQVENRTYCKNCFKSKPKT